MELTTDIPRTWFNRFNKEYFDGALSDISQNITEWKVANNNLKSSYLVMAVELNDGKCLLPVVNPKYKDKIDKDGKRCEAVKSIRWFTSSDNYFIKYNKVRTFKGLFVDRKTFEEKCKDTKK